MERHATSTSAHLDVLRNHAYHPIAVKAVVEETPDASTFVLSVPPLLEKTFTYEPGQFCTFRVTVDGTPHFRSYSMSSTPALDPDLAITVKRVPGGLVSNWLLDNVRPGHVLEVSRPAGVFCPTDRATPVVAFCGGSGVTPVMSIAKAVLAGGTRSLHLLYANRSTGSVIFRCAIDELAVGHQGRLHVTHHFDSQRGLLTSEQVASFAGSLLGADFYICGPGPFMDMVEGTLLDLGVMHRQLFIERFTVTELSPVQEERKPAAETVTLLLKGRPATVSYRAGDTVLQTARRAGLQPPFSCEAGDCATCMAFVHEGTVRMRNNNALTAEEVAEGWILTCQAEPTSPILKVEWESI